MTHAEKQDGDFHGSMFNDLYDTTNWRRLREKTTKGEVIAAPSLPVLPANGATGSNDTTSIDAEYVVHIDHTKDEHQMGTGFLVGELAVLFDGAHVRAPGVDERNLIGVRTEASPAHRSTPSVQGSFVDNVHKNHDRFFAVLGNIGSSLLLYCMPSARAQTSSSFFFWECSPTHLAPYPRAAKPSPLAPYPLFHPAVLGIFGNGRSNHTQYVYRFRYLPCGTCWRTAGAYAEGISGLTEGTLLTTAVHRNNLFRIVHLPLITLTYSTCDIGAIRYLRAPGSDGRTLIKELPKFKRPLHEITPSTARHAVPGVVTTAVVNAIDSEEAAVTAAVAVEATAVDDEALVLGGQERLAAVARSATQLDPGSATPGTTCAAVFVPHALQTCGTDVGPRGACCAKKEPQES